MHSIYVLTMNLINTEYDLTSSDFNVFVKKFQAVKHHLFATKNSRLNG